jgi:hypothetical protein
VSLTEWLDWAYAQIVPSPLAGEGGVALEHRAG